MNDRRGEQASSESYHLLLEPLAELIEGGKPFQFTRRFLQETVRQCGDTALQLLLEIFIELLSIIRGAHNQSARRINLLICPR